MASSTIPELLSALANARANIEDVFCRVYKLDKGDIPSELSAFGGVVRAIETTEHTGYQADGYGGASLVWPAFLDWFITPWQVTTVRSSGPVFDTAGSALPSMNFWFAEVTGIYGASCFAGCSTLLTAGGENVREISAPYVFTSCTGLNEVYFPECSALDSAIGAFKGCTSLSLVTLPKVTALPSQCFSGCSRMLCVSFPSCMTVGSTAFCSCAGLTSVSLPRCETVEHAAFMQCSSLRAVSLPAVRRIGSYAFSECGAAGFILDLREVQFVPELEPNAFPSTLYRILVPVSLYSAFLTASLWSDYAFTLFSAAKG